MRKVLRSRLSEKNGSIVGRIESTHGIHVFMSNPHANNDENEIITVKETETGNVPEADVGGSLVGFNDHAENKRRFATSIRITT